ncbi:hypothetical protein [Micromonospora sp. NPDC050495]|uniref:hypothetical protein n=1 Tax=Micromonospora sp. NPDC050495 TaxID=3154936 RepID=UPI00340C3B3E
MMINRRTLLKGLAAAPVAITGAAAIGQHPASAAGAPVGPQPAPADLSYLTASHFKLAYRTTTRTGTVAPYTQVINDIQLNGSLPWATVDDVLNSANRTGVKWDLDMTAFAQGWTWDPSTNDRTGGWVPQGITTSADYADVGTYNGRRVTLVSWYDNLDDTTGKGARISFVDMTNPAAPKYRHVLLVEPFLDPSTGGAGMPNFKAINFHAGGLMWYGKLLYVVDTNRGIRVFDTTKMLKVTANGDESSIGRQSNGSYTAHNYAYVLPQSAAYDAQTPTGGERPIQWSFISLDRTTTPDSILVGEYGKPEEPADHKRLFRFSIDASTRLLTATSNVATATSAIQIDINEMNGATSVGGKYFISRPNGNAVGDLITWVPGNNVVYNELPVTHPEDLSYDKTTGWLWNLNETQGERYVFARKISLLG